MKTEVKYFRSTTVSTAKERGQNSGLLDANRNDRGLTDNPYGMDSEPELYQAWEEGYEETFCAK